MAAIGMAAIGVQSSEVALGAMCNLDRDRPLDWFSSERVELGREVEQLPPRHVRGPRDGPSTRARRLARSATASPHSRDAPVADAALGGDPGSRLCSTTAESCGRGFPASAEQAVIQNSSNSGSRDRPSGRSGNPATSANSGGRGRRHRSSYPIYAGAPVTEARRMDEDVASFVTRSRRNTVLWSEVTFSEARHRAHEHPEQR